MPTYEHRCEKCGKTFERTESLAAHDRAKPSCPKCGSRKVSVVPSRIYTITAKKS
jgi:putative FmdB family regulatory protein